jgi:hypothetical protein
MLNAEYHVFHFCAQYACAECSYAEVHDAFKISYLDKSG